MSANWHRIPKELQDLPQWMLWKFVETDTGKPTKVPVNPRTGWNGSVTDPQNWAPFDYAVQVATERGLGIGFVFTERDEFCGIDLDTPTDPETGQTLLSPEDGARQTLIFETMDSYSEISPSGNGLHIFVKASVPHGRKRQSVEIYSSARFFTMTGNVYNDKPIADRQELVQLLWSQLGGQAQPNHFAGDYTEHNTDEEIYNQASRARNGDLFLRLWNGDITGFTGNSEADFALVDIIAFYTKNRMQIVRLFMMSELGKRAKYAAAKPGRRAQLMGYMVDKSFDRMLPPIDFAGVIDEVNAAMAALKNVAPSGADQSVHSLPGPVSSADQTPATPSSNSYDGMDLDLWRKLKPNGLLGECMDYIYAAAPRPVYEIAMAAALGLFSGICGRAYNVSKTGLNHYIMLLSPTGAGKEAMASGISRLMTAVEANNFPAASTFIGPAEIASGQALLKHLSDRSCFVSLVGEIGLRLQQMTDANASHADVALRRVMLDLYAKSGQGESHQGTIYSDKKNNTPSVMSPAFSMLGDSTPETFYRALDEDAVTQGLLPRFTIIEYGGERVPLNFDRITTPSKKLVQDLSDLCGICLTTTNAKAVITVELTPEATAMFVAMDDYSRKKINKLDKDVLRQLWNRFDLRVVKLAALLAVSQNNKTPVVTTQMMEWARSLVLTDTLRLLGKFQAGEIGAHSETLEQDKAVKAAIRHYLTSDYSAIAINAGNAQLHAAKLIPQSFIQQRLVGSPQFKKAKPTATYAIKSAIQTLIEAGQLQQVNKADLVQYQFQGVVFAPLNVAWFLKL